MSSVLITGCSSGYGKATAQVFLNEGWNVVATMRRPQNDLFEGPGERLRVLPLDVTDDGSIRRALDEAIAAFGGIDVLVNNAGIGQFSPLETTSRQPIKSVFETIKRGLRRPHFLIVDGAAGLEKAIAASGTAYQCRGAPCISIAICSPTRPSACMKR